MAHRVVVTGWGVLSSIGHTAETYWSSLARGVCGIAPATLVPTDQLAQKVRVIRSSANADAAVLDRARRDHVKMIEALQGFARDDLIALTRRHLKAAPEAYARAYRLRFGEAA